MLSSQSLSHQGKISASAMFSEAARPYKGRFREEVGGRREDRAAWSGGIDAQG